VFIASSVGAAEVVKLLVDSGTQ